MDALAAAGLQFEIDRGTGVVLHLLAGLAMDGRVGLTSIGHDADHAGELYEAAASAIAVAAASPWQPGTYVQRGRWRHQVLAR